jgi:hypothetical protein
MPETIKFHATESLSKLVGSVRTIGVKSEASTLMLCVPFPRAAVETLNAGNVAPPMELPLTNH